MTEHLWESLHRAVALSGLSRPTEIYNYELAKVLHKCKKDFPSYVIISRSTGEPKAQASYFEAYMTAAGLQYVENVLEEFHNDPSLPAIRKMLLNEVPLVNQEL